MSFEGPFPSKLLYDSMIQVQQAFASAEGRV